MFAILALLCFVLVAFGIGSLGVVQLLPLGLAFVALHLLVGLWPLNAGWVRRAP